MRGGTVRRARLPLLVAATHVLLQLVVLRLGLAPWHRMALCKYVASQVFYFSSKFNISFDDRLETGHFRPHIVLEMPLAAAGYVCTYLCVARNKPVEGICGPLCLAFR